VTVDRAELGARPVRTRGECCSEVAGGGARWMEDPRPSVRVLHAHLGFEAVWIDEEHRQDGAEVRDETVGGAGSDEPSTDLPEAVVPGSAQPQVVDAAPTEHRRSMKRLFVAR